MSQKKEDQQCKNYHLQKDLDRYQEKLQDLAKQLLRVEQKSYKIIFLDEIMFTYNTLYYREYSNKNTNIEINQKALSGKTRAVIACVSQNSGLEYFEIFDRSVDIQKFVNQQNNQRFALFLDNMRVHHAKIIKKQCQDLDIPLIFNLPYSPQYNPIENVFSLVKNDYKRLKLQQIEKNGKYKTDQLIRKSFLNLSSQDVKHTCKSGYEKIMIYLK